MPSPIVGKDENLHWPLVAAERPSLVHCYHPVLLAATFILGGSLVSFRRPAHVGDHYKSESAQLAYLFAFDPAAEIEGAFARPTMTVALGSKNAQTVDGRAVNAEEVARDGMSILLISDVFPPTVGGSGRWFWEIYRRLPPARIVVAAGEAPGARAFDAEHDLKTERLKLSFSTLFIRPRTLVPYAQAYRSLRKLIQRDEIARLHAARGAPEGLLALAVRVRTGIRYCCYAHGEEVNLSNPEERPPLVSTACAG